MYYARTCTSEFRQTPREILEKHGDVTQAIDVMFINRIPFIITMLHNIHFGTAKLLKDMKNTMLITSIEQVMQAYIAWGFKIKAILGDGQFQHIQQDIQQKVVILNICSANEHVPEIERYIRTLKECVCSIATILPFKEYPPRVIVEMVYNCVFWLNSFPHRDGIHDLLSPRTLFGTYVQVHEKHNDSMESRTSGTIALRPSGNEQGGHYFLSLHTGKRI